MDDALNSGNVAIQDCKTLEIHDKAVFGPRLQSLQQRVDSLMAVSEGGSVFNNFVSSLKESITADSANTSKLQIPKHFFDRLVDRATLKAGIAKIGDTSETEEQLVSETKAWENNLESVSVLVQAVRSAITYFNSAKRTRDRHIDNRQRAQAKAAVKAKATAKPQSSNFGASKNAIFDINLAENHAEVPRVKILMIY